MRKIVLLLVLQLFIKPTFAQHDHHGSSTKEINHVMACRSGVNYIDNLPAPKLMNGVGHSDLKIKTTSELAQKYFSQGVSQLHCFWPYKIKDPTYKNQVPATRNNQKK